jgi:predicted DNA-binding WGR domain protein
MPGKRYFEFRAGTSAKFWEIDIDGTTVLTRYGKIGSAGQITTKEEGSPEDARKLFDRLVRKKLGKRYVEKVNADSAPAALAHVDGIVGADLPRASSPEIITLSSSLGLVIELHPDASAKFDEVFAEMMAWYSDSGRANAARVFAFSHSEDAPDQEVSQAKMDDDFRGVLEHWLKKPLPTLDGEELSGYVANCFMIDASHSETPDDLP